MESDFNPDASGSDSNEDDEENDFSPDDDDSDFDDHSKKRGKENKKNIPVSRKKSNPSPKNNKPSKGAAQKDVEKGTFIDWSDSQ